MAVFVGRQAVLAALDAALRTVTEPPEGVPRLPVAVLISGSAGMGKSTVLSRWTGTVGSRVAWGTCWQAEQAPAFWGWSQVLRALPEPPQCSLLATVPAVAAVVPEWAPRETALRATGSGRVGERLLVFEAVAAVLAAATRSGALVVVLDDLQWTDGSTIDLWHYLTGRATPGPLLLLGAYRHDDVGSDQAAALGRLGGAVERIPLGGLSPGEVADLARSIAGGSRGAGWAAEVHRRTGGQPYLVRELAHAVAAGADASEIPVAVHEAVAQRVARVSSDAAALLAAASVAGSGWTGDFLADLVGEEPDRVAELLDEAAAAGLVSGLRFTHDIVREAVYDALPGPRRIDLHHRAALALVRRDARGGSVFAADVARHFAAAAPKCGPEPVLGWAFRAATADADRFAFAEAAGHLSRARAAVAAAGFVLDDAAAADLLVAQADARLRTGDAAGARQALEEAWGRAVDSADPDRVAAVALGWDTLGARFAMPRKELIAALDEARRRLDGTGTTLEARVIAALARQLQHSVAADRPRAGPLAARAVEIARALAEPDTLTSSLLARHDVLWTPGKALVRADIAAEMEDLAAGSGDLERQAQALLLAGTAQLELGSPAFRTTLTAFEEITRRLRQPRHDYLLLTRQAAVALLDGDIDQGDRLSTQAAELGERIGESDAGNVRMSQLLEITRARGDPDTLRDMADRAIRWWVGAPGHAHAVAAGFFARAGDLTQARDELDVALALPDLLSDRSYLWSVFVGELVAAAVAVRDLPLCEHLLDDLLPLRDSCAVNGAAVCFGGAHAQRLGELCAALGRPADARAHLEQALRTHRGLGARAWEAESCSALATLGVLDDGAATSHANRARSLATTLGLSGLVTRMSRAKPSRVRLIEPDGAVCRVHWAGRTAILRDSKGLRDLAVLLDRPGVDVPAVELAGAAVDVTAAGSAPMLDRTAATAYRHRLAVLEEQLADAAAGHDLARHSRAGAEREQLLAELRRTSRPGGRPRPIATTTTERARKAVTARIRDAIERVRAVHPELAAYLDRTVRTGVACRYQPEDPG